MISEFMTDNHRACDAVYAAAEEAAGNDDQATAQAKFGAFLQDMERHFAQEESVLFPTFEELTGNAGGPTAVMRIEHQQMRDLFAQMERAVGTGDLEEFIGLGDTLVILMQQHNMKEEQILYPMTDQSLGGQGAEIIERMQGIG
jgi:hemerythrin-like domain-containing protein